MKKCNICGSPITEDYERSIYNSSGTLSGYMGIPFREEYKETGRCHVCNPDTKVEPYDLYSKHHDKIIRGRKW